MSTGCVGALDLSASPMGPVVIGAVRVSAAQVGSQGDRFYLLDIGAELVELPEELYVRDLWDLDLGDERGVGEFIENFGPPSSEVKTTKKGPKGSTGDELPIAAVVRLESIRSSVSRLRNAVRCWDHLTGGLTLAHLQAAWEGEEQELPRSKSDCVAYLRSLEPALECFHPIFLGREDHWPVVSTHSALAAQLFNRVVTGEGFKHCEEETCGRPFTRYESRTERSQSKVAKARFCSQRCSDRYFNREFRRRGRAQRLKAQGLSVPKIAEKMGLTRSEVNDLLKGPMRRR